MMLDRLSGKETDSFLPVHAPVANWNRVRWAATLMAVVAISVGSSNAAERDSKVAESEKVQEISPRMLENRFNEINENVKTLRKEIEELQQFQHKLRKGQTQLVPSKSAELNDSFLKPLKDAIIGLSGLAGDVDLKSEPVQKLVSSYRRLLITLMEKRESGFDAGEHPRSVADVIESVAVTDKEDSTDFAAQIPNISKLYGRLHLTSSTSAPNPPFKWEELKAEINAAVTEANQLEELYKRWGETTLKRHNDYLTRLDAAIQAAIQTRQDQIGKLEKDESDIAKKLDQQRQDQHSADKMLVYAVYAMIAAIVLLFLSLRLFKDGLATAIVNERTMIELLSMGFLLLTLIILGTGKQLQENTLGTLLGTVAGYIFGRKEGERRGAQQERQELVKMVGQSHPA
jgi:hypothetical protein